MSIRFLIYSGSSMNPTLRSLDILEVVPYEERKVQTGDVIVFFPPGSSHMVSHRVVSINHQEIKTQGDKNRDRDSWVLSPERIVGQVIRAHCLDKPRWIYRGLRGRLYAWGIRLFYTLDFKLSSLLHPLYHWLAQIRILKRYLAPYLPIKIVSFQRPRGKEFQLLLGWQVIGRLLPGEDKWQIRRPFRLLVNEVSIDKK